MCKQTTYHVLTILGIFETLKWRIGVHLEIRLVNWLIWQLSKVYNTFYISLEFLCSYFLYFYWPNVKEKSKVTYTVFKGYKHVLMNSYFNVCCIHNRTIPLQRQFENSSENNPTVPCIETLRKLPLLGRCNRLPHARYHSVCQIKQESYYSLAKHLTVLKQFRAVIVAHVFFVIFFLLVQCPFYGYIIYFFKRYVSIFSMHRLFHQPSLSAYLLFVYIRLNWLITGDIEKTKLS